MALSNWKNEDLNNGSVILYKLTGLSSFNFLIYNEEYF